jgi:pimeloyl-ACP methyl ester carboxylesterase
MSDANETLTFFDRQGPAARGTVIVLAGRGETAEVYRRFGTRLAFDAYPVHVIPDPTRDPGAARAQVAAIAADASTVGPVVLAGSDTGALFAASLTVDGTVPEAAGLILAGLPLAGDPPAAEDWDTELGARTTCPTHRGRISNAIVTPGALYEPIPDGWADAAALDRIAVPTLAIHGREDPISPLDEARDALGAIAELELVVIAGAPHDALNDQTHRTVAAIVVLWLERLRREDGLAPIATVQELGAGRV